MSLFAAVGYTRALDAREAGLQATHKALNSLGSGSPALAIVISAHQLDPREVAGGVASLIGNSPLIGVSAPAMLTSDGLHNQGVVVALMGGTSVNAETHWFSGYAQSGRDTANRLVQAGLSSIANHGLIFFADGFNGDAEQMCLNMPELSLPMAGGLSGGDLHTGHTYQFTSTQSGTGSLAAMVLRGDQLRMGVGYAHGWGPVGSQFRVTRSKGFWLRTLDGRPASESYAQLFGYPARDWAFPPLTHLSRLYPLGVEQEEGLLVRSPLRVEADGSFRMNATIRDGQDAYLMVSSPQACQKAARQAAQQALTALGNAKPVFALVIADIAWQMQLKAHPGEEAAAVQDVIGAKVPIAGVYTLGQVVPGVQAGQPPQFLNQHMVVAVFGEGKEE